MTARFHLFGDECCLPECVVYGVLLVPPGVEAEVQRVLSDRKRAAGVPDTAVLHCREVFHSDARARTQWHGLSDERVFAFAEGVAGACNALGVASVAGWVNRASAPPALFPGEQKWEVELAEKQLAALAFQTAVGPLCISMGAANLRLWVDPDRTRVSWVGGSRRRADSSYSSSDDIATPSPLALKPEPFSGAKPTLLEVADLLAYSCAQALSPRLRWKRAWFERIARGFQARVHEFVFGPPPSPPPAEGSARPPD